MIKNPILNCLFYSILLLLPAVTYSQKEDSVQNKDGVRFFLDCDGCDFDYIKTEINFVDFVNDRFSANVYVLPVGQPTGSGGRKITAFFSGQEEFEGINDTIVFYFGSTETEAEKRKKGAQYIKLGLMRYLAKTNHAMDLEIKSVKDSTNPEKNLNSTENTKDKWDFWVFNLGAGGSYNTDDLSENNDFNSRININRITEKSKIYISSRFNTKIQKYTFDGVENKFAYNNYEVNAVVIKSVAKHWSAGLFSGYAYSTFDNYKKSIDVAPAVEYSVYKYEESTKKSITLFYQVGPSYNEYIDSGYYDSPAHLIYSHTLSLDMSFTQQWGSFNLNSSYISFLNSFYLNNAKIKGASVNKFSIGGYLNIRIVKGLSASVYASADFTKGIFPNIPRDGYTRDDLLTNSRQYPTGKSLGMSIGLNYRFGSIYSNVVNPRFANRGY